MSQTPANSISAYLASGLWDKMRMQWSAVRAPAPLPPMPPTKSLMQGHLQDVRDQGFMNYLGQCVEQCGPVFWLRLGPPPISRRWLLITDPEVAEVHLREDEARRFLMNFGPPRALGAESVFVTDGFADIHKSKQKLIGSHVSAAMLRQHSASMRQIWADAVDRIAGVPHGVEDIRRFNFNQEILRTVQRVAIRCWLGVDATEAECQDTLNRYYDPGIMLSEALFHDYFWVDAQQRVESLRSSYRPLFARSLEKLFDVGVEGDPQLGFISQSLDHFGWDQTRLATDRAYRQELLDDLEFYKHLFGLLLPAVGSTGGVILFMMHELGRRPDYQEQVRRELATAPLDTGLKQPKLTGHAIMETLRLYPQASGIARYIPEGKMLGDFYAPSTTFTFVNSYHLHRNPKAHEDPLSFRPERFAEDPEAGRRGRWVGFSHGRMACTGRSFAELNITSFYWALLRRYRLCTPEHVQIEHNDYQVSVTLQPQPFELDFIRLADAERRALGSGA